MKTTINIVVLSSFLVSFAVLANDTVLVQSNLINPAQTLSLTAKQSEHPKFIDPLSGYMRTVFPKEVDTVREAVLYVLEPTGYKLVTSFPAPTDANILLNQRLPLAIKVARTMPIIDVLQLLIGTDNTIIVDPGHRLISFERGHRK